MTSKSKPKRHQRRIRFSVVLPATVELIVGTDDDDPSDESNWEILSVIDTRCEATPKMIEENMDDRDFESLAVTAASAEDLR
jgi:hypothetical protein